ncbi:hypothetical protein [Dendronalium sp. ChiSLP03b]|uniref:hypothetical protein n=1 Tax=Dendronalium sp. ChiSLP03b TaxID=3075381 RepID=UPI0039189235
MPKSFQVGGGNKVKVYVALLPLGDRIEPDDVSITAGSGITSAATSVTVTALSGPIAAGTPLTFDNGTSKLTVYLAADAKTGDTSLTIEAASAALTGSSTAEYLAKLRLLGGTQLSVNLGADRTESLVFEDPLGYADGVITKQNWELPWTANLLSDDDAFRRVYYAASQAVSGREIFVWQEDPPPKGKTVGDGLKGTAVITNFSKQLQSDAICTISFSFNGQGSPTITRFS